MKPFYPGCFSQSIQSVGQIVAATHQSHFPQSDHMYTNERAFETKVEGSKIRNENKEQSLNMIPQAGFDRVGHMVKTHPSHPMFVRWFERRFSHQILSKFFHGRTISNQWENGKTFTYVSYRIVICVIICEILCR